MVIARSNFPVKKALIVILSLLFSIIFYRSELALSDGHIPQQEEQPAQSESTEIPLPKQIPGSADTEVISPQHTEPPKGQEFPTRIDVPDKLPSTKDLKDIKIKQPSGGTQLEQPIPVPDINFPSDRFTPKTPTAPIVYQVVVSDCVTRQLLSGADVELGYLGNRQARRSNIEGIARFMELPPEGIEAGKVEVKKQGYDKAEISTTIFASRNDNVCINKDSVVVKPTQSPLIVSGPNQPKPAQPPVVVSQPTDTLQPQHTPSPPPQNTEDIPSTTEEHPSLAEIPKKEKHPHTKHKKNKPQIYVHRQSVMTSRRSEELIYEEEFYPETVVGDPVFNKIETDEKISRVARLLREKKQRELQQNRQTTAYSPNKIQELPLGTYEKMPLFIPNQILVLLQGPYDNKKVIKDLENLYRIKLLGSFTLKSIDSTLALFEIPDPGKINILIDRLESDKRVISPQPNYYYSSSSDKYLQYGVEKIKAHKAHEISTGRGIKVAVIDTGVDYRHSVLSGKILLRADYVSSDEAAFTYDPHGTSVAGIIAASVNEGAGMIGISPDVSIISVKACWSDPNDPAKAVCSSDKLAPAIDFSITNKANIINFSLGGPRDSLISRLISKAVDENIIVVAAGGNGGPSGKPVYPAALGEVIAVSATDASDSIYSSSTRGGYIDISAPGVEIFSPAPGNSWQILSGTSMAAAHVSGTIALLLQTKEELSTEEVKNILSYTAVDLGKPGRDQEFGEGRIDAYKAVSKLLTDTASSD